MYGLVLVTPPVSEPVAAADAKLHARIDLTTDDVLIGKWIAAAREYVEAHTGRAIVTQTWRLNLNRWPCELDRELRLPVIELPIEPVAAVNSVKYYASNGTFTTLALNTDYQVDLDHSPPLIAPAYAKVWPPARVQTLRPIQIEFVAGVDSGWPVSVEEAIYQTLTYWNQHRGDSRDPTGMGLPAAAMRLLDSLWTGCY